MTMPKWYKIAESEIGTKEIAGPKHNSRVLEYHATTTLKATNDETPWCSAFVNWCVTQAGIKGTNLANARSWLKWGKALDIPTPGCIVVFRRGSNPQAGHVAFFHSFVGGGYIKVLGGNQADQVKFSNYPIADVLGYRTHDEA